MAALSGRWDYSIERRGMGRLVYREANREYTFPAYEENGILVLAAEPSAQRIHLFFNWYPSQEPFSAASRQRILRRIRSHLQARGVPVQIFERAGEGKGGFEFHAELFAHQSAALALLVNAGLEWLRDFSSVDLIHEDFGLEVCGIREEPQVGPVIEALQLGFPHWHHCLVHPPEHGAESGWSVTVCMFRPRSCTPGQCEED